MVTEAAKRKVADFIPQIGRPDIDDSCAAGNCFFPPPFSVLWYFVVCVALVSGPSISMWELDVVLTTEWWMSTSL